MFQINYPKDKNGNDIKAGCTIYLFIKVQVRERPGDMRIAFNPWTEEESVVPDEGSLKAPTLEWVKYKVRWSGACLIAERIEESNSEVLREGKTLSLDGSSLCTSNHRILYLSEGFRGQDFEVKET